MPPRGTARGGHRRRPLSSPLAGPFPDPAEPRNQTRREQGLFPRPVPAASTGELAGISPEPPPAATEDPIARPQVFLRANPQTEGTSVLQNSFFHNKAVWLKLVKCIENCRTFRKMQTQFFWISGEKQYNFYTRKIEI
jgi:hypothetical protein